MSLRICLPLITFLCFISLTCKTTTAPPIATVIDTTSHNFTWTVQALGDGASSSLEDVAIVNDSLAYAVGRIYFRDSLGNWDPDAYNIVKWDGKKWTPIRLRLPGTNVTYEPIAAIWVLAPNDILLSDGGMLAHFDGTTASSDFRMTPLLTGGIVKIYARGPQEIYMVGRLGTIVYLKNDSWIRISSGTDLTIRDIWGGTEPNSGIIEVFAIASNAIFPPQGKRVLRLVGSVATVVSDSGLRLDVLGVWYSPDGPYYIVGDGVFQASSIDRSTIWRLEDPTVTQYATNAIRGNASNDLFIAGSYGDLVHYNGSTWRSFQSQTSMVANFWGIAMKGDLAIAVGDDGVRAYVAVGRRNK